MLVAHISDTHLVGPGLLAYAAVDCGQRLRAVVKSINSMCPSVDAVVLTGDVAHVGAPEAYREAYEILNELACPYLVVPGNHDDLDALHSVFRGPSFPVRNPDEPRYEAIHGKLALACLSTARKNVSGGVFDDNDRGWLEERLQALRDYRVFIICHHPPVCLGTPETEVDGFSGADVLGRVLRQHPNVERILCGHAHIPSHVLWEGCVVSAAPAVSMPILLDLSMKGPSRFYQGRPSYLVHLIREDMPAVTHMVNVEERGELYQF